jgi:hypothetical protein
MLPPRPSFAIKTNVFGEIWIAHKNQGSSILNIEFLILYSDLFLD